MPKVTVPQASDDITIRVGTADPKTWHVTDHVVDVDDVDLDNFLRYVDGAKASSGDTPAAESPRAVTPPAASAR